MAKQELIPGGYFANEKSIRQYLVPGYGYLDEKSPNVFSNSLTETLTAVGLMSFGSVTNDTLGETLSASVTNVAANAMTLALAGAVTSGPFSLLPTFRLAQELVAGCFYNETAARQFLVPGRGFIIDTGRTVPVYPVVTAFAISSSESLSGSDSVATILAMNQPIAYPATLSDLPPGSSSTAGRTSSVFGRAKYGEAAYGASGGDGRNPTYIYPYIYVAANAPHAAQLVASETDSVGWLIGLALDEALTAYESIALHLILDALLLKARVTKVGANNRTVIVES
jgi:hypothetical protein